MDERGTSLVESLIAIALVGLVAVGIMSASTSMLDANTRCQEWSAAMLAAQETMEAIRLQDPAALPTSGQSAPQVVTVEDRQYEVVTHYCTRPEYCASDARQLLIKVSYDGEEIFDVETVYTQMR